MFKLNNGDHTRTCYRALGSGAVTTSEFDLTNSINTSINSAHAQGFITTHQNKIFHDHRVFYNMSLDKHFY